MGLFYLCIFASIQHDKDMLWDCSSAVEGATIYKYCIQICQETKLVQTQSRINAAIVSNYSLKLNVLQESC